MRHPVPLTPLGVAALAACLGASEQTPAPPLPETLMETWQASVVAHRPGERDEALAAVAGWSRAEWNLAYPRVLSWSVIRNTNPARTAAAAAFWKRAALLHTDIAMLEPTANEPAESFGQWSREDAQDGSRARWPL